MSSIQRNRHQGSWDGPWVCWYKSEGGIDKCHVITQIGVKLKILRREGRGCEMFLGSLQDLDKPIAAVSHEVVVRDVVARLQHDLLVLVAHLL